MNYGLETYYGRLAQKMLGHRQISTTLRYAHVLPEDLRDVSDKLVTKSKKVR